jgi:threonine aldolase
MSIFLDGARLLHSCIANGTNPRDYGQLADAVTMCFSKGLGSPFGAILAGELDFIARARRFRKWFGGGLHQSGYMAAAALYAMTNNVDMLFEDHSNAALLGELLAEDRLMRVKKVETNMVMFDVTSLGISAEAFVSLAAEEGVLLMVWRGNEVRAVTSSLVSRRDIYAAGKKLLQIAKSSLLTLAS